MNLQDLSKVPIQRPQILGCTAKEMNGNHYTGLPIQYVNIQQYSTHFAMYPEGTPLTSHQVLEGQWMIILLMAIPCSREICPASAVVTGAL